MSERSDAQLNPEAPHAPGTPSLEDLDVDVDGHDIDRSEPDDQPADEDVREDAGSVEPPD
jgi:hypothetical protein